MKSIACISASVRAACHYTPTCFVTSRGFIQSEPNFTGRSFHVDFPCRAVVAAQQPCVTGVRYVHRTHERGAVAQQRSNLPLPSLPLPLPGDRDSYERTHQFSRSLSPKTSPRPQTSSPPPHISPYIPYAKPQGTKEDSGVTVQSLFEGDVIPELCSRLAEVPCNDRIEGLATLLGMCVEFGVEADNPVVSRLRVECLAHLSKTSDVGVAHLCHLGEAAYALEGHQSAIVSEVISLVGTILEEEGLAPIEAAGVYSLLALCYDSNSRQQALMLPTLHRHTERLVHRLKASHISDILQSLVKLQQRQAISLVLRLSRRASRVFKAFKEEEVISLLSSLMVLGHHDDELLAAMEKHLPGRLGECDPELTSTVMEYCMQMRCRSEPIFEAAAEAFVCHAEKHTTPQIARQIVAMGRLNYLPQCSSQMFQKLESVLSSRFSQFQPRSLIELLHACIHLERFPINYMSKVFSPYFLHRLQAQRAPLDKNALGQLTQLNLTTSLECTYYRGPRLPYYLHVKTFSSVDRAFETPMDSLLYNNVKGPLTKLLGGQQYAIRSSTPVGYVIDVELCLDEEGLVLPKGQWEHSHKRMALCLDGQDRFCSNTQHLLGKEATKRRHLRRMGYEVVQIPYFEFDKLRCHEERFQYLQNKIFPTVFKFNR